MVAIIEGYTPEASSLTTQAMNLLDGQSTTLAEIAGVLSAYKDALRDQLRQVIRLQFDEDHDADHRVDDLSEKLNSYQNDVTFVAQDLTRLSAQIDETVARLRLLAKHFE